MTTVLLPYLQFQDQAREGGTIIEPLAQARWGDHFGACVDRSGTSWMVNIGGSPTSTDGP